MTLDQFISTLQKVRTEENKDYKVVTPGYDWQLGFCYNDIGSVHENVDDNGQDVIVLCEV